ncbi:N-formylglutamate amidohydrolase [Rhodophyticola sp. CCM32]|uniref:N-formylglutamate amidohydrolase n=1 Tax=Rhodophyticola sp. CCM32 TaxID=2916397 RepID=UPI00107F1D99|nr:N-formylglutamate amidohydrolase [Rhodophyticola sp. CCM32]QBX99907.1 N-formylglutamate amidohydrolase [Rhodophyticola sp. CCM32]
MKTAVQTLLGPADPAPVEVTNGESGADIILLCEHAGRAIPRALGSLGVSKDIILSHRGWDIGAEQVARKVADRLQVPLVIQKYSRLVIDCNRPPDSPMAVPGVSDHAEVPGNRALTPAERAMRIEEVFRPMDAELTRLFESHPRRAAFSIHSFTPRLNGFERPWHAGFLSRRQTGTAQALMDHIAKARPDLTLAINEPYQIESDSDWFIPAHAEPRGLTHSLIEIRNDQIREPGDVAVWADLLAGAITAATGGDTQ